MRKIIYECDGCSKTLSDDSEIARPHISVNFASPSGWVSNHAAEVGGQQWKHDSFTAGIFQFCSVKCLANHFRNLANAKKTKH